MAADLCMLLISLIDRHVGASVYTALGLYYVLLFQKLPLLPLLPLLSVDIRHNSL